MVDRRNCINLATSSEVIVLHNSNVHNKNRLGFFKSEKKKRAAEIFRVTNRFTNTIHEPTFFLSALGLNSNILYLLSTTNPKSYNNSGSNNLTTITTRLQQPHNNKNNKAPCRICCKKQLW